MLTANVTSDGCHKFKRRPAKMETLKENTEVPTKMRVSLGSAMMLGLAGGRAECKPSTAYLMTHRRGKCTANCGFCPQARESSSRTDLLSRVTWPVFDTYAILNGIKSAIEQSLLMRVCIQALNYPRVFVHLRYLIGEISRFEVPVSVSCQPRTTSDIRSLAEAGAQRIGIALDAATEKLFKRFKGSEARGPYVWKRQFELLKDAVQVFGKGGVSTHLIAGLGETELEMVRTMQVCIDMGVLPALFAFTPIKGTQTEGMAQPSVSVYRRLQAARHLIVYGLSSFSEMEFDTAGRIVNFGMDKEKLWDRLADGGAFVTSGCPGCNRPFYNEKPSGPIFNYPRKLASPEISETLNQLEMDGAEG